MTKYHINPKTGNPGRCNPVATGVCKYGASSQHFATEEEARAAYENQNSSFATPEVIIYTSAEGARVSKHNWEFMFNGGSYRPKEGDWPREGDVALVLSAATYDTSDEDENSSITRVVVESHGGERWQALYSDWWGAGDNAVVWTKEPPVSWLDSIQPDVMTLDAHTQLRYKERSNSETFRGSDMQAQVEFTFTEGEMEYTAHFDVEAIYNNQDLFDEAYESGMDESASVTHFEDGRVVVRYGATDGRTSIEQSFTSEEFNDVVARVRGAALGWG